MESALVADLREMLVEQRDFRELLYQMTRRDLLLRYKQSVMGFGWAILMPLLNTAAFSVIFMRVAPINTGIPYPLFAYSGLLAWHFFASALRFSVTSLTTNSTLVTKVYFPREVFPFSAVIVAMVDLAVGAVVLVGLMIYYRTPITAAVLFLPVVIAAEVMLTAGMALLLAMANLFYRDVKYLFEVFITVWMFATSVLYPMDLVGGRLGAVLLLNPMTPIIDAFRAVLLKGELPAGPTFLTAMLVSMTVLVFGWLVFHRAEFRFAESV